MAAIMPSLWRLHPELVCGSLGRSGMVVTEEPFVPFDRDRKLIPLTSHVRSTWLTASVQTLKREGYFDRYLELLPKEFHEPILTTVAGVWLPVEVALAHYGACDRLEIGPTDLIEIGNKVSVIAHGSTLDFASRLAKGAGVTPWVILVNYPKIWARIWQGGAVGVFKLGPKEARIEFVGMQCARFVYYRMGLRGVLGNLGAKFCTKGYVAELPKFSTDTTVAYRYAWV